jgi:rifamycin polyketide synthase module 1/2/3
MIRAELIAPIGDLIGRQASQRPAAVAFVDRTRSVTYGELADRTARLAAHLEAAGVRPGQSVALFLPHGVAWVEACFAVLRASAVAVPVSVDATDNEIAYRLSDAGCVAAFAMSDQGARLSGLMPEGAALAMVLVGAGDATDFEAIVSGPASLAPRDPRDIEQASFIVYTSGTTGQAKGVLLSLHSMLWVAAASWASIAGLSQDDYVLNPLPLYHSYALNLSVLGVLATGAKEYLLERFSTTEVLRLLDSEPFTLMPGVPTMFRFLLDTARARGHRVLSHLRLCLSAGAVLGATLNQEFEAWFGVRLLDGYGITETSTMVTLNWPDGTRVMGSCGLPLPGLAVRVVDPEDRDVEAGHEGELIVRGPNVMLGYHGKPEATRTALRGGWYRTGDLARFDRNGYLTITGRLKEVIIRGGQNISPVEVEETVAAHRAVADCAVVGMPHELLGEVPVAFVVARDGEQTDPESLLEHCRSRLSAYKVPQAILFVPEIPRTGSGKAMRFRLRQMFSET